MKFTHKLGVLGIALLGSILFVKNLWASVEVDGYLVDVSINVSQAKNPIAGKVIVPHDSSEWVLIAESKEGPSYYTRKISADKESIFFEYIAVDRNQDPSKEIGRVKLKALYGEVAHMTALPQEQSPFDFSVKSSVTRIRFSPHKKQP